MRKEGGTPRSQACLDRFKGALENCELHDLGFIGDVFTWRNKQTNGCTHIRKRLDRAVANAEWRMKFSLVQVRNGDPYHSDHRPVIINTEPAEGRRLDGVGDGVFRFEAHWLQEESCRQVVQEAWTASEGSGGDLGEKIRGVAAGLKDWSVNVLGDLEKRLKKAKKELEKWRREPISDFSVGKEAVWSFKVDRLEEQVDLYWKQRAHVNWLNFGDHNTSILVIAIPSIFIMLAQRGGRIELGE